MNIAVCDDDEITLKEVSRAIKGLCPEAEIEEFDSGNKLINRDKRFDIIILDIDMPEMNGMVQPIIYAAKTEPIASSFSPVILSLCRRPLRSGLSGISVSRLILTS